MATAEGGDLAARTGTRKLLGTCPSLRVGRLELERALNRQGQVIEQYGLTGNLVSWRHLAVALQYLLGLGFADDLAGVYILTEVNPGVDARFASVSRQGAHGIGIGGKFSRQDFGDGGGDTGMARRIGGIIGRREDRGEFRVQLEGTHRQWLLHFSLE